MPPHPETAPVVPFLPVGFGEEALAVFDLDGTLIKGDSFLPFLITYARRGRRFWPIFVLPFFMLVFLTAFEILVSVLQAYIFTILTAVYIGGAVHPEH